MQTIRQAENHLVDVTTERSVYREALEKAKSSVLAHFSTEGTFSTPPPAAERSSNNTPIHGGMSRIALKCPSYTWGVLGIK